MYTKIKASLRQWICVCAEAFGSFSQRLLCCHGNACWTRVLWIFQQPPFFPTTWDLFITLTTYKTFHVGEDRQSLVNWSKRLYSSLTEGLRAVSTKHKKVSDVISLISEEEKKKHLSNACINIERLHKCKQTPCMLKRYLFTAGEAEASEATTFSFFLSVSFRRPWALG